MVYGLTIASGAVLIAVFISRRTYRGANSFISLLLRHALKFLIPFFLVALFYAVLQYWLGATSHMMTTTTTIAELEHAIAQIQFFSFIRSMTEVLNPFVILMGLILLGLLPFVAARFPFLGTSKKASAAISGMYTVLTLVVSFAFFAQSTAPVITEQPVKLNGHVDEIERKAVQYKREAEDVIRGILKEALIEALGVTATADQFRTVQEIIRTAQEEIAVHEAYLNSPNKRFAGDAFEAEFTRTWQRTQDKINTLYWDREPPRPTIADVGRNTWFTLQFSVASVSIRNVKLSRSKKAPSDLHEIIDKTFDVVYASKVKPNLGSALGADTNHPVDLLVLALADMLYTPVTELLTEHATAMFRETIVQKRPVQDVVPELRTSMQHAMDALKAHLTPRLEQVTEGLKHVQAEALRIPQELRHYAKRTYGERLQTFRHTWQQHVHFASEAPVTETAVALMHRIEATLKGPATPLEKLKTLAAYEKTLQTLSHQADDLSRYQTLVQLERTHLDTKAFARVVQQHAESRLAAQQSAWRTMSTSMEPVPDLAMLEARSRWLQTHRVAVESVLEETGGDASTVRDQGTRARILESLTFDAQFVVQAIQQGYQPEVYTKAALRKRIRAYVRLARALEPPTAEGGEFVDTASGNLSGTSAKGALRFEIVDVLARTEARLRLSSAPEAQSVANVLREERDAVAISLNGSEKRYVNAMIGLWREADGQPEVGAHMSEVLLEAMAEESRQTNVPAVGALKMLRRLVDQAHYKVQEIARLQEELARKDAPRNDPLRTVLAECKAEFHWVQNRIRTTWAETRRQLRVRAALKAR